MYGIPPPKSKIKELADIRRHIPKLIQMVDHPIQILWLAEEANSSDPWPIFIKIDCGTHRAGVPYMSEEFEQLLQVALKTPEVYIYGFYCHSGHSYNSKSIEEAEEYLLNEIEHASAAGAICKKINPDISDFVISVGATPTANAASTHVKLRIKELSGNLELHAGNFPVQDLQQVETGCVRFDDVASWIEAEVCSVYPDRMEVLVNVGVLGLGREPGREQGIWGRATFPGVSHSESREQRYCWNVIRLSQEHGIIAPRTKDEEMAKQMVNSVEIGSRVRIIPQHACIAGAMYDWYNVVESEDGPIQDVWIRCRGW